MTQNTKNLRLMSDANKIELLSKHLGVDLEEALEEQVEKDRLELEEERLKQEEAVKLKLLRERKAQREFVKNGLLSGQILAITPKRKFFNDVDLLTDADCLKIKLTCRRVSGTISNPAIARELHLITTDGNELLVICRRAP